MDEEQNHKLCLSAITGQLRRKGECRHFMQATFEASVGFFLLI